MYCVHAPAIGGEGGPVAGAQAADAAGAQAADADAARAAEAVILGLDLEPEDLGRVA